jgi:hypothetical protein
MMMKAVSRDLVRKLWRAPRKKKQFANGVRPGWKRNAFSPRFPSAVANKKERAFRVKYALRLREALTLYK